MLSYRGSEMSLQVLPALRSHSDEYLLKELYKRWSNHKVMVRWLSRFFNYLDRQVPLSHILVHKQDRCTELTLHVTQSILRIFSESWQQAYRLHPIL